MWRRGFPLRLDQAAPDRVAHELHPVAHPQLGEDVRAVALDRLLAEHEVGGDLAGRARLGDQLDDLDLAWRQRVVGGRLATAGAGYRELLQPPRPARGQEPRPPPRGAAGAA